MVLRFSALTVLLLSLTHVVAAQGGDAEARVHFEAGSLYYNEANYEGALAEFSRAYDLSERPALLFNMSQCYERLGRVREAVSALERYVADTDDEANRELQRRRLENLRARATAEEAAAEEQAQAVAAAGAAAEAAAAEAAATEAAATDRVSPPRREESAGLRTPAFVLMGIGGAGLITFAVAGGLAAAENSRLEDFCLEGEGSGLEPCTEDTIATLETRMLVADIGLVVGVAALATGVILLLLDGGSDGDETAVLVAPDIRADGGGAVVQFGF